MADGSCDQARGPVAVTDRSAKARWAARAVPDGARHLVVLRRPVFGQAGRRQVVAGKKDHALAVVMVGGIMAIMIRRVPMPALFGVPCGVVGLYRNLAGPVGEGGKDRGKRKGKPQHDGRKPRKHHPPFVHLHPWRGNARHPLPCPPPA